MTDRPAAGCRLSIVVPAFNEQGRIGRVLRELDAQIGRDAPDVEIVVVDDGSADGTYEEAAAADCARIVRHERNQGRARAVQTGIAAARGQYVAVFDADYEYLPADVVRAFRAIGDTRTVVYGSRYLEASNIRPGPWGTVRRLNSQGVGPWLANWVLAFTVGILFNRWYSEHLSGIRIYPRALVRGYRWQSRGFEGDHELAAAALVLHHRVIEVPCSYRPRSKAEGKKIRARDGFKALGVFVKWRLFGTRLLERLRIHPEPESPGSAGPR